MKTSVTGKSAPVSPSTTSTKTATTTAISITHRLRWTRASLQIIWHLLICFFEHFYQIICFVQFTCCHKGVWYSLNEWIDSNTRKNNISGILGFILRIPYPGTVVSRFDTPCFIRGKEWSKPTQKVNVRWLWRPITNYTFWLQRPVRPIYKFKKWKEFKVKGIPDGCIRDGHWGTWISLIEYFTYNGHTS